MSKFKLPMRYIVVHCSATPPSMDIGRKEIDLWHRQRGFNGIGYHAVIRRDGTLERGRDITEQGAHAAGFNAFSLGVCLVGGVKSLPDAEPESNYTPAQMTTLKSVIESWKLVYPDATVIGHHDLPSPHARSKACPCFDTLKWVQEGMQPVTPPTRKGPKLK